MECCIKLEVVVRFRSQACEQEWNLFCIVTRHCDTARSGSESTAHALVLKVPLEIATLRGLSDRIDCTVAMICYGLKCLSARTSNLFLGDFSRIFVPTDRIRGSYVRSLFSAMPPMSFLIHRRQQDDSTMLYTNIYIYIHSFLYILTYIHLYFCMCVSLSVSLSVYIAI